MRTVEASRRASFGSQGAVGLDAGIHQRGDAKPSRGAEIVWSHRMATEQIGHLTMTPKQRGNQRCAARPVCLRIEGLALSSNKDAISGWLA